MYSKTFNVISYCDLADHAGEVLIEHWINEYQNGCFVPFKLEEEGECELSDIIRKNYPDIDEDEEFLIEIDY